MGHFDVLAEDYLAALYVAAWAKLEWDLDQAAFLLRQFFKRSLPAVNG